jgi:hypothetical protein
MDVSNKKIAKFRFDPTSSVLDCAGQLRRLGYRVCGMEDTSRRGQAHVAAPREIENVTLAKVLDAIIAENSSYRWEEVGDLLNIFPQDSILDEQTPAVNAKGRGLWRILKEDLQIEKKGLTLFSDIEQEEGPLLDVQLEPMDIRHALNAIVAPLPRTFWQISGRESTFFLTLSAMPDLADQKDPATPCFEG